MENETKICRKCNIEKELCEFGKNSGFKSGIDSRCKECIKKRINLNKLCGIYKITSPTGKVYIGESKNINKRRSTYKNLSEVLKSQRKLYNSLKKYGWEVHTFEIIEECNFEDLLCRERYWQDFYDVLGNKGLNLKLTNCGELKMIHSEEMKKKISQKRFEYMKANPTKTGEESHLFMNRKGEIWFTQDNEKFTIIEYINNANCTIEFEDGEIKEGVQYTLIRKGIKRRKHLSKYKHVSWKEPNKKWQAYSPRTIKTKSKYLGIYSTEEEASEAVRKYLNLTEKLLR